VKSPILKDLLNRKDSQGIKDYLEGLKATEKGLAFEQFLELSSTKAMATLR
jgi:hypothetical protein